MLRSAGLLEFDDGMANDFQTTYSACAKLIRSSAVSAVNTAIARELTGDSNFTIKAYLQQMPTTSEGTLLGSLASGGGSLLGTILLFPLPLFLYPLVLEKSNKLREMMKLSGMQMKYYWLVTLGMNFILYMVQCLCTFILGYILGIQFINGPKYVVIFSFQFCLLTIVNKY